ncbi:MAG: caspase family protein, partial [bacterium]|nr:caspase family protein [bacterium]
LHDTAYDMKGYAIMTSSSSDEASQESDRLAGSFFTHYLTSGLRGAADMTRDGRVTLNEAYQFAFNETLAKTTETVSGPQHPNYNIKMSGTGDVVITDIRQSAVILNIAKDISGKIFVHNQENVLVVELNKPRGREIELGLEQGKYKVINLDEGLAYESDISLAKGNTVTLDTGSFKETDKAYTTPRGTAQ